MIVYYNFKKEKGTELVKVEKESLRSLMPLYNMQQVEGKKEDRAKVQHELNLAYSKKQKWLLGLLTVSIAIAFLSFCYTVWKDQRTTNLNDFKDDTAMKEFILNQVVQAR
jgi:hypothetical protein